MELDGRIAVVTGAGAGIGRAIALRLARDGADVVVGDLDGKLGGETVAEVRAAGGRAELVQADMARGDDVRALLEGAPGVDVLVNNAGGALGLNAVADAVDDEWIGMWKTNVLGLMWMTRACLPLLRKARHGHIVNIGSIAGFETYKGGAGYTAVKHAVRAITKTLRLELNGEPIRVTEIAPGLVETEFSLVRFHGDRKAARVPYEGIKPLTSEDIADCIVFAVTRPAHVDIDEIVVRPVAQANVVTVARKAKKT